MDWSYSLLSELERSVLRRLAVFVGHFTLDAVTTVCGHDISRKDILNTIDSLIAKSMVATRPVGTVMSYRLLDTTRAYALDIQIDETEAYDLAARHAAYCIEWLGERGHDWSRFSSGQERTYHFSKMNSVRAALEWCFGEQGNATLGVIGFEERWEYAAIGNVPNLAARLCGVAHAGEIILDAQTEHDLTAITETEPVGPLTLRGFSQPVAAFRLKSIRN